jgi:lipooligosaccharide transport system permease protein
MFGIQRQALVGVLVREAINFRSFWKSATFSAIVQPLIYLLAFGLGFGSLVSTVGGVDYVEFVSLGIVATAVLFSSVFAGIFSTLVKWKYQGTYNAIMAAPVTVLEVVTAEGLFIALRSAVFGCAPLVVGFFFGLTPTWGMLLVPFIAYLTGFGFGLAGIFIAGLVQSIDNTSYIQSAIITPLFLLAGTFFPIDGLPQWAQTLSNVNPLYHCVQLVQHAAFGFELVDLWHTGALVIFAGIMWWLAVRFLGKRLID